MIPTKKKKIEQTWKTFLNKYYNLLPKDDKVKVEAIQKDFEINGQKSEKGYYESVKNATQYWQYVKKGGKSLCKNYTKTVEIFEKNAKKNTKW